MMRIFIIIGMLVFSSLCANASNYPLQIAFPIPAGTGTPMIPSTHPIFRAYPGIAYNIRPHIQGGAYPFTFALSGQPAGMTINASTGEINWPEPDTTTGAITLTVTDSELTIEQSTWVVTVSTSGYLFVDASYTGTETGSINQPFSTIENLLAGTADTTTIVYFRTGTYHLPVHNPADGTDHDCNMDNEPTAWIGYPGETATIDMDANYFQYGTAPYYFDSLTVIDIPDWFIHEVESGDDYAVLRRLDLSGGRALYRSDNANQGVYYTSRTVSGYYLTVQDNTIHDMDDLHAVGSLYEQISPLIEDNTIYNMTSTIGGRPVFASKHNGGRHTYRRNNVYATNGRLILGGSSNGLFRCIEDIEVMFNRFDVGETANAAWFNNDAGAVADPNDECGPPYIQGTTFFYRNTVIGHVIHNNFNDNSCAGTTGGPWDYSGNVIVNSNNSYTSVDYISYRYPEAASPENCITDQSNVKGTASVGIVDADGLLVGSYRDTYLGVAGWEIGDAPPTTTVSRGTVPLGDMR